MPSSHAGETFEDPILTPRAPSVPDEPHLFVVFEGERISAGGARYSLASCDEVIIARGAERAPEWSVEGRTRRLTLTLPDRRLSSVHGKFVWSGDRWFFEDAGSRNGSMLNGRAVKRAPLGERDFVQVGHTFLALRGRLPTPAGTPDAVDTTSLRGTQRGLRTLLPAFAHEVATLTKVARSLVTVLVTGEMGTGKEVVSRALHALSREGGPLIAVNCGAIPATLVESQLFGHVRGSFSGAVRDEPGLVRAAHKGTLFLDEIGDLPLAAQPALLRVIQEREVVPVGGTVAQKVDVRIVSATNRPLAKLEAEGQFRSDLLARLTGFTFALPALRDRRPDLGLLMADMLDNPLVGIAPDAAWALLQHRWPQNIRELSKTLALGAVLAEGSPLGLAHLPSGFGAQGNDDDDEGEIDEADAEPSPRRVELIEALERFKGNVTEVAQALGTRRPQVYRWLKTLRIDPKLYRS